MAKGLGATTVAVGNSSRSLGSNAVAVGNTANAGAAGAIAIGQQANYQQATSSYRITGPNSIAVGVKTNSSATRSIAIGTEALVEKATVTGGKIYDKAGTEYNASVTGSLLTGENSIAIGAFSVVRGTNAAAIGQASEAVGQNSFAGGNDVHAIGKSSLALGDGARSENDSTIAIGYVARSTHQNSTAIGNDAQSSATGALAIGKGTRATGTGNVVLGVDSKGEAASVVAIGNTSLANQENSVAIGNKATAQGTGNVAIGTNSGNVDTKTYSGTVGSNTVFVGVDAGRNATGNQGQVAVGWQAGQGSIGTFNVASGYQAGQFINGSNNVAIGKQAGQGTGVPRVSASDTVAIGTETKATANNAIAIGKGAQATGLQSISIGVGNIVSGANSGALGDPSHITGIGTYAIGNDNGSADNPIAADNAGVFGNLNRMTADADNSRAIGNYNHITTDSTYVLGSGINSDPAGNTLGVTVANSVYLGNDSQVAGGAANAAGTLFNTDILNATGSTTSAGATGTVSSATVNNITYEGFAGQTAVGAVTVGAAGSERRIQNVAAGEISETSTDAINGSQLYFVVEKLQDAQTHYYSVNDGGSQGANYDNKGATGTNSLAAGVAAQAVALNATAVGHLANAAADNATVLGNEATATAKDTVAVGQSADATADSAVAVGKNAQGAGNFAVSIGLDSQATNDGAVAMGSGAAADNTYTVAIGNDAKALQDGATALGRLAKAESEKSLALGTESQVTSLKGIAIGVNAKALGGTAGTTKTGNIAIGNAAQTESNDSVVIGTNAQATVSAENAIVIGKNAAANNGGGNNSVAIGKDAVVTADGSIALGEEAKATAFTTTTGVSVPAAGMITAIGYKASGSGMGSVALGSNASTTQNAVYSVAIGNGATAGSTDASGAALRGGRYGVAVGNGAKAIADNSAAFGPSAQAQNTGSLALGHSAIASVDSGVALGANSLADVAGGMVGADPLLAASDKNNSTWTSSALYGAVSVGSSAHGITRQITNLAAGTQDTDAVNVAQLKAAGFNLATSASSGEQVDNTASTADKKVQNGETVTVDAGKNIKITQNANTISVATKDDVSFTTVTAQDAQGNRTVLGANGVTITLDGSQTPVSLTSSGLNNGGNVISNVANGSVAKGSTEAVTGDQLYAIQQQLSNSVGSVNQGLNFTGNSGNFNRKMGENTTIKGTLANDVAASSSNIRTVADSSGNIEIMLANAPTFTGKVTAQGLDAGGQKITNVQAGSDGLDAVNVQQLQSAMNNISVATQNVINANSPFSYVNSQGEMLHRSVNPDGSVTFTKSADNTPYTGSDISIAALNAQAPQSTIPTTLGNIKAGTQANDAVNVSQLQNTVAALGGGAAINSDGTFKAPVYNITGTTGAVATVNSVGDALTALNTEVTKALTFSGDNSIVKVGRKLGEELAVKGGAAGNLTDGNIGVTGSTADNSLLIKLAEQINLGAAGSLQTGGTTVNNDGIKVEEAGKQTVSLTSDGLNNGGNNITNVAAGKAPADAVNVSQLTPIAQALGVSVNSADGTVAAPSLVVTKADGSKYDGSTTIQGALDNIGTEIQKPINFAGNSGSLAKKLSETFTIKGGLADGASASSGNIRTKVDNGEMVIELAESPKFGGVTINDNGKITGVTSGNVAQDSKEAVNGGQLYAQGEGVKNIIGGTTVYNPDTGAYTNTDIGGTGQGNINDAIATVKSIADAGWNLTAQGANSSKVGAGETVDLRNADNNITVTKAADADTVTFDLADAITVDSVTAGGTVLDGNGLKAGSLTVGTNGKISGLEAGSIAAGSKEAVNGGQLYGTADSVANALGGGSTVNADGTVSAPSYTIIDPATGNSSVANNVGDALTKLNGAVNSPLTFAGDSGSNVERKLGTTVNLKGGATGSLTDNNIAIVADGTDTLNIKLAKNLSGLGSIQTVDADGNSTTVNGKGITVTPADGSSPVSLTSDGINAGGKTVAGVGEGKADTDAVNVAQLKAAAAASANKVAAGDNIEVAEKQNDDGSTTYTVATAKNVSFDSVTAGGTVLDGNGLKAGSLTVGTNGKISGLEAGSIAAGSKEAVNGGQLYAQGEGVKNIIGGTTVYNPDTGAYTNTDIGGTGQSNINDAIAAVKSTADAGWNLTAQGANSSKVSAGETVDLRNADSNITVTKAADTDTVVFDLADAISVDSVKAGNTTVNNSGVQVGDKVALASDGLKAGDLTVGSNGKISGLEAGSDDKDAVNVAQLKTAAAASANKVAAGDNIEVAETKNNDGSTTYTVATAKNVNFNSVTAGDTVLNQDGVKVGNDIALASDGLKAGSLTVGTNGKISGLEAGSIAADSKEAVNGGQLYGTANSVANALGGGSTVNADGTVSAPSYTIIDPATGNSSVANNVGDAVTKLNSAVNSPLTFAGDSGSNVERKLGTTVNLKGGATGDLTDNNIAVVADGTDTLNIKLAKELSGLGSIQTVDDAGNSTTVNGKGITVTPADGSSPVSLTSDGINAGGKTVAGVGEGKADTDAVNVAQLKAAAAASANKVAAGDNIEVAEKQNDDGSTTYTVATAKNVSFDSVTAGDTVLNQDGVKVGNDVALASDGLKAGSLTVGTNGKISGLENGSIAADSKEAVNGGQLYAQGKGVETIIGGATQYDPATGTYTNADIGGTGKGNLNDAIAAVKATADKGWNLTAQGANSSNVGAGESVDLNNSDGNIVISKTAADDNVTFDLADAITVDSVTAGTGVNRVVLDDAGVSVGGNTYISGNGINANNQKVTNVASGSVAAGSTDAVNGGQLYNTAASVANALGGGSTVNADGTVSAPSYTIIDPATGSSSVANNVGDALTKLNGAVNSPLTFAGDSGSNVERKLGTTVNLKGGATGNLTDNNIAVVANGTDTLSIKLAETVNLGSNGSVTTGQTVLNNDGVKVGNDVALTSGGLKAGDVNITSAGIDAGNKQISGVKAGEQDTDAANVAQLKAAAAASANKVAAGDNIEVAETKNNDGSTTYTVATAKNVNFDSVTAGTGANRVVLDDTGVSVGGNTYISGNGINANNQKVTNVASGSVAAGSTDAVNGGQLHNTAASVANVFGGNATVNTDGSVSMSNIGGTGANNVNDAIAAVNQAAVEAKTTVSAGDNIVVAQSTNADGSTNYTVSTAKDLAVDSVKAGDAVLNNSGLSIANGPSITASGLDAGGKKITNVADGEISATSKDAINGSQLYQAYQVLGGNANAINTITAPATENADGTTTPAGTVVTVVTNPDGTKTTTTETNQTVAVSTDKGGNQYTLTTYNVEGQNTYVTNDVIQAVGKMNEQGIKFFHTNDGVVEPVAQGHNTEDSSASGAYATAIGYQSVASGEGAVAMGNTYTASIQVDGAQVTEVKDAGGNVTGYAQSTVASGTRAIAMGTGSQALAEDSIAIGTGNVVTGKQSGAIGDPTVVTGDSAYSIGNNNTVSADNAYALGSNIKATLANSVYLGDNASATAVHTTAGGGNYTFAGANDANVAGVQDAVGVVSVGTEGETRQIQNVAAGVVSATSTDAINGSQLYYTNEAINSVANYTVNMGNQLNQRIDDVENRSNAGAATAMAVAGLPQAYMPGKSMVAVAGGVYRGESGYAVGYSSISDNGNWVIKGSATGNSRGHYGATAGVGYQW